jgi:transcriptional regulator GlxA family with amidase domain
MKHLSILVLDEQSNLSTIACIVGAYEIFTEANTFWKRSGRVQKFEIELVSAIKSCNVNSELFSIKPHSVISEISKSNLIIIPSSLVRNYETAKKSNKMLIKWIEEQYKQGAEVASMCTGIFMLASTGLLAGKTCSTHWAVSENFNSLFPKVKLQTDKLITDENGIYTNGGAYSFLQLIIYLIEKHYDRQTAVYCAKVFQIDLDRNLQSEFSIFKGQKTHDDDVVLKAQTFIEENYQDKISIDSLSIKFNVGRRNFDRRFIKATGLTPLDYLQRIKIEVAKKSLENTRKTVNEVMYDVGYNDTKAFRGVFDRITGMSPIDYKSKYNKV